jgi:hypothetical protein
VPGVTNLRVEAGFGGAAPAAVNTLALEVSDRRWAILFFDPRASWNSTFVRRELEQDPRFVVTSRVMTSRNVSRDAGRPPDQLDQLTSVSAFDAIVVGAPEALSENEVSTLELYLRRRAGAVLLLYDQSQTGAASRLAAHSQWRTARRNIAVGVRPAFGDSALARATEFLWPVPLPAGAAAVAVTADSTALPVVWQTAVGAGTLVVSGALDAWRFRDPAVSAFGEFWRATIAQMADVSPPPLEVGLAERVLAPGASTAATVTLRDLLLVDALRTGAPLRASVAASLQGPDTALDVRLWPHGAAGRFSATVRAPAEAGTYRFAVTADGYRADVPLTVIEEGSAPAPEERDLLGAWARVLGGTVLPSSRLGELPRRIEQVVQPSARRVTWHPMRSAWWILPFALALAAEWWWRRRLGLA